MIPRQRSNEEGFELSSKQEAEQNRARIQHYIKNDFAQAKSPIQLYLAGNDEFKDMSKLIIKERLITLTSKPHLKTLQAFIYNSQNNYIDQSIVKDSLLMGLSLLNRIRKDNERSEALPDKLDVDNAKTVIKQLLLGQGGTDLASYKYHFVEELVMRKIPDPEEKTPIQNQKPRYSFGAENNSQATKLLNLVIEVIHELEPTQAYKPAAI